MKINKTKVLLILINIIIVTCNAQPVVTFNETPPLNNDIAVKIGFSWQSYNPNVEYRYKLEVPEESQDNRRYAWLEWSPWGHYTSTEFNTLIFDGTYIFHLEAKYSGENEKTAISQEFNVHFNMPQINETDFNIDWAKVSSANSFSDK